MKKIILKKTHYYIIANFLMFSEVNIFPISDIDIDHYEVHE